MSDEPVTGSGTSNNLPIIGPSIPPNKSILFVCGKAYGSMQIILQTEKPNWFFRMTQRLLLGWEWEDFK